MSREEELEKVIHKQAMAIEELTIRLEMLDRQTKELFAELNVSPEQLTAFLEKKEHFTEENWQALHQERQTLDAKLQTDLSNMRNLLKAKKTYTERQNIQPHWLFVR